MAPIGPTKPAAGVIATKPATQPDAAPNIDGLPLVIHSPNVQPNTAAAVASKVVTNASAALPLASNADPALNPNQPNHKSEAHHGVNQVMRLHCFFTVTNTLADNIGAD